MFDRLRNSRWFWKYRHLWNPKWTEGYKNLNAPHRKVLVEAILKHNPKFILEVGCGAGANLRLIHELSPYHRLSPHSELDGVDINPKAVKVGKKWNGDFALITIGSFDGIFGGRARRAGQGRLCER